MSELRWLTGPGLHGFTLVELLVVLLIVGVLCSLLLPVIAGGKRAAKTAVCRSNLRMLGIATASYTADTSFYPAAGSFTAQFLWAWRTSSDPSRDIPEITQRISTFVFCPERLRTLNHARGVSEQGANYTFNGAGSLPVVPQWDGSQPDWGLGLARAGLLPWGSPIKENEVVKPSDMIAFIDGVTRTNRMIPVYRPYSGYEYDYPHRNSVNAVLCDGHVESITRRSFQAVKSGDDDFWRRWNRDHEPHPEVWRKVNY